VRDIHAAITDRFIEQLRAGCIPWQRPWQRVTNFASRKAFRVVSYKVVLSAEIVEDGNAVMRSSRSSQITQELRTTNI
jgi:hypothetical protein